MRGWMDGWISRQAGLMNRIAVVLQAGPLSWAKQGPCPYARGRSHGESKGRSHVHGKGHAVPLMHIATSVLMRKSSAALVHEARDALCRHRFTEYKWHACVDMRPPQCRACSRRQPALPLPVHRARMDTHHVLFTPCTIDTMRCSHCALFAPCAVHTMRC
eukprot:357922-Chlamydomonas_euryale.AAC.2